MSCFCVLCESKNNALIASLMIVVSSFGVRPRNLVEQSFLYSYLDLVDEVLMLY